MFTYSASIDVNPPGSAIVLTHPQVWRGLEIKAEAAIPFVPGMTHCEVLERYDDGFLREVVIRGERLQERITFTAPNQVHFLRVNSPNNAGWITNLISESEHGLLLTFTFAVRFPGVEPGTAAEKERGEGLKTNYRRAIERTLARCRELVSEKQI
jgi:hypothetical protein